jgi:hypothetical protein
VTLVDLSDLELRALHFAAEVLCNVVQQERDGRGREPAEPTALETGREKLVQAAGRDGVPL